MSTNILDLSPSSAHTPSPRLIPSHGPPNVLHAGDYTRALPGRILFDLCSAPSHGRPSPDERYAPPGSDSSRARAAEAGGDTAGMRNVDWCPFARRVHYKAALEEYGKRALPRLVRELW